MAASRPLAASKLAESLKARRGVFYRWAHIGLPLLLLAGVFALRVSNSPTVELAIMRTFDAFQRLHPRPYEQAPVRVIDIDDESLAKLGQWPWPRTLLAKLVTRLHESGAAAIAFDAVFSEPDRLGAGNDAEFARAIKSAPVVLGFPVKNTPNRLRPKLKASFAGNPEFVNYLPGVSGSIPNLPILAAAASGVGTITTGFDPDGVVRRVPLALELDGTPLPGLAAEALRVAQGAANYVSRVSDQEGMGRQKTGILALRIGRITIPTDHNGRAWIYYSRREAERTVPAWKVLSPGFDRARVEGCIVFVGTSAEGLKDLRATPLEGAAPGVETHANLAEQALLGSFLKRPDWGDGFEIVYMLVLGVLLVMLLPRLGAVMCLPIALVGIGAPILFSRYMFLEKGFLVDPLFPATTTFAIYISSSIVSYLKSEAERRQVKGAFSRYMSPALVEQLAKHPEKLKLGGETREMTWHFCDIRGFTTISEQFDPHGLVQFINRFLTPMTEIILKHQGVIDKYMGDCIMAFWNAPLDDADHARHACRAALEMHARLAELNAQWEEEAKAAGRKFIPIRIGTGLNTGPCVVGNMGSDMRFDYSVLGDEVNLASRLEGQSKTYGVNVVIGPKTRERAPEFAALELDLIRVKGKTVPVRIYALLGGPEVAQREDFKAHAALHDEFLAAYRTQRWDEARRLLALCRDTNLPLGKLYDLYEHRMDDYAAAAPPADWDGTYTATSK